MHVKMYRDRVATWGVSRQVCVDSFERSASD